MPSAELSMYKVFIASAPDLGPNYLQRLSADNSGRGRDNFLIVCGISEMDSSD